MVDKKITEQFISKIEKLLKTDLGAELKRFSEQRVLKLNDISSLKDVLYFEEKNSKILKLSDYKN
jgi:hypothetical protein